MPPPAMGMLSTRRHEAAMSQQLCDITDDRYRELRKLRKVLFYCNGDPYFRGKTLRITPNRYLSLQHLMADLTCRLQTHLPFGVRQIYTLRTEWLDERPVLDIEDLQDGRAYVCAGNEKYKPVKYGESDMRSWMVTGYSHNHQLPPISGKLGETANNVYGHGAFAPPKQLRHSYPKHGMPPYGHVGNNAANKNGYLINSDLSPMKPKMITVVRNGGKPRTNVKILLLKRGVQSFEELIAYIAEAFNEKWKNDKIKKLYTLEGQEVKVVSDFFRKGDVFIGSGQESLTSTDVDEINDEFYPNRKERRWDKQRKKKPDVPPRSKYTLAAPTTNSSLVEESKRDSGYGDSDEKDEDLVEFVIKKADRPSDYKKNKNNNAGSNLQQRRNNDPQERQHKLLWRLERERDREEQENRDRTRKRTEKRLADGRRASEEDRRKLALALNEKPENPFKKMDAQTEADKRQKIAEERRRKEEEEQRLREENERRQREMEDELERLKREREELERNAQNDKLQRIQGATNDDRLDPGPVPDTGANSQEVEDDGKGNGNSAEQGRDSKGDSDRINGNQNAGSPTKDIGKVKKKKVPTATLR